MSSEPISAIGEKGLIQRIKKRIRNGRGVVCGIGDDCAVLRGRPAWYQLFASDMLVERVHFLRSAKPEAIGWKALAVNVSDIAAMGGIPRYAVISLGLPRNTKVSFVDGLYRGLTRCAAKFGVSIVGGDTSATNRGGSANPYGGDRSAQIAIDVAILGEVEREKVVYRCGAKVGDTLFVTGKLGGAVQSGRHLTFTPRLREARALVDKVRPHAMIDLSDGLGPDLIRICEASGISAQLDASLIPRRAGASLKQALTEGEDFELLMSVSPRDARALEVWASRHLPCGLTRIGKVMAHRKGPLVSILAPRGVKVPGSLVGFQHF